MRYEETTQHTLEFAGDGFRAPAGRDRAGQRPAPWETGIDFVPELDLRFAQLPAEIDLPTVDHGREIDQAFQPIFRLGA